MVQGERDGTTRQSAFPGRRQFRGQQPNLTSLGDRRHGVAVIGKRNGAIYTYIEEMYGERVVEVVQTLSAATVPEKIALGLNVAPGSPALQIERVYKSAKHRVIEVAFNLHPADRFSYSISLRPERG